MEDRINLSPLHWGPKTWFFLESAGIAYPVTPTNAQKQSAKNFILSLRDMLPCESCRIHYGKYIDSLINDNNYFDTIFQDRDSFMAFIISLHNDVRKRNGQDERSIEDVFSYYEKEYSKPPKLTETFTNSRIVSKDEIIKNLSLNKVTENFTTITSDMLFHFNPITLLIGVMVGLIIYKFYSDNVLAKERN
jgi:hypothetical protein